MKMVRNGELAALALALSLTLWPLTSAAESADKPVSSPSAKPAAARSTRPVPASAADSAGEPESAVLSAPVDDDSRDSKPAEAPPSFPVRSVKDAEEEARLSQPSPSPRTSPRAPAPAAAPAAGADEEEESSEAATATVTSSLDSLPPVTTTASVTQIGLGRPVLRIDLGHAIALALTDNPSLKASARDIEAARWRYYQQRAQVTPRLDGQGQYRHQTLPPPVNLGGRTMQMGASDLQDYYVQLKHTLYTFGRQHNYLKQRRNETQAYRNTYFDSVDDLVLQVKKAFFGVLLQKELVITAEQNIKELKTQHDYALARFQQGAATEYDVLLARSQLANARPDLIKAKHQLEISSRQLLSLLGIEETVPFEPVGTFDEEPVKQTFDQCLRLAMANRQDLKSLEAQRRAYYYGTKALRAGNNPTLSAAAMHDRSIGQRMPMDEFVEIDSVTVSLDVPFYDGGLAKSQARENRAKMRKVDEQIANTKLQIRSDVTEAYLQIEQAVGVLEAAEESVLASEKALTNAEEGFQAGVRTSLEVLQAETNLTTARTNVAQARNDYAVAKATLARKMGTDLSVTRPVPKESRR